MLSAAAAADPRLASRYFNCSSISGEAAAAATPASSPCIGLLLPSFLNRIRQIFPVSTMRRGQLIHLFCAGWSCKVPNPWYLSEDVPVLSCVALSPRHPSCNLSAKGPSGTGNQHIWMSSVLVTSELLQRKAVQINRFITTAVTNVHQPIWR